MANLKVGDLSPRAQYTASSGQTAFSYAFPIFTDADLKVYVGATLKTLITDYTVSGAGDDNGGTVTLVTGAATGDIITIQRDMPIARTSDYQTNGDLLADTLNDDLDKLVMMSQQNEAAIERKIGLKSDDLDATMELPLKDTRANKMLGFDENGNIVASSSTVAEIDSSVSAALTDGVLATSYQLEGDGTTVEFTLIGAVSDIPNEHSVIIDIDGITQHADTYTTIGKTITFSVAPPANSDIQVRFNAYLAEAGTPGASYFTASAFQFTGDNTTTAFTLTGAATDIPTKEAVIVDLNGVTQHTDTYTTSGTVVTFDTAPPTGADIQVRFTAYAGDIPVYNQGGTGAVSRTVESKLQERVSASDFGSGVAGLNAAIANGGEILISGEWSLASADLAALSDSAIKLQSSNTTITGINNAKITVTGTSECGIFYINSLSNIKITNIEFVGNNVNTLGLLSGSAIQYTNTSATVAHKNITVDSCVFSGFKGDAWIKIERDVVADYDLSNVRILNNTFSGGGTRDASTSGVASAAIYFTANNISGGSSYLKDCIIENNIIDAAEIKQGIQIMSNSATRINLKNFIVKNNVVRSAGVNNTAKYGYGISVYGYMAHISVLGNQVLDSYSTGIYSVFASDVEVMNNYVDGQAVDDNTNLSRAGIAFTANNKFAIRNNVIKNCINGIEAKTDINQVEAGTGVTLTKGISDITGNTVSSCTGVGIDVKSRGEKISVSNNNIQTPDADQGIYILHGTANQNINVDIQSNTIIGKVGFYFNISSGAALYLKELNLHNNDITSITGNGVEINANKARNLSITDNRVTGPRTTGTYGIRMSHLTNITSIGNFVNGFDKSYRTDWTTGTFVANRGVNSITSIISAQGGIDLGLEVPSGQSATWVYGSKVEKMNPVAGGTEGWIIIAEGTFGTLNSGSTTGGITSGTAILTVSDNTELVEGQFITISGVTGNFIVESISGVTITLNTNADATVSSASVSFAAPTVKEYGAITA